MRSCWLLRTGIGDDRLRQLAGILEIPDRVLQQARCGLLDQIELLLRIEDIHLDREGPAQHVEQGAEHLLPQLRQGRRAVVRASR